MDDLIELYYHVSIYSTEVGAQEGHAKSHPEGCGILP